MTEPSLEYEARRAAWLAKQVLLQRQFISIGNARLAIFAAACVLAWFVWGWNALPAWSLLIPLAVFVTLLIWHEKVIRRRTFAARGLRYYDQGLDRLRDRWQGKGEAGERFRDANHVYAEDLDVFGKGGMFELLSAVRTAGGEDALAQWLLHPADAAVAAGRQEAVREWTTSLDLREELALLGEDVRAQVRADAITRWGIQPAVGFPRWLRRLSFVLSLAAPILILANLFELLPRWPVFAVLLANALILNLTRHTIAAILERVDTPASHLTILALLIQRIEQEQVTSPLLRQWMERLQVGGLPAASQIRRLERWIDLLGMSSPLMAVLQWVLLWRLQVALGIEEWRRRSGPHLGEWIQALGDFEALSSLASLAYERPSWTFPELLPGDERAIFRAKELRHPLMAEDRCVANNVTLDGAPRLLIVSGSNMSGKSTLLRSIGLNTVLAWAGAPVSAAHLELSPLQTGASIRVTDSLQDNRSRFFAEITRLRQIVDLTQGHHPVLFLLDELLSGTNSHDRRIGAAGLVKGLLRGNTIGLLTTHDLALTEIANDVGSDAENVHFEDRITAGQVEFDYQLRPGIVTHSNALELMRAVGLEV